jgi:hypothetical protein
MGAAGLRHYAKLAVLLAFASAAQFCFLNPQPEPPASDRATGGGATGGGAGPTGGTGGTGGGGGGPPPINPGNPDASITADAAIRDASVDASTDAGAADRTDDASDGGDEPDAVDDGADGAPREDGNDGAPDNGADTLPDDAIVSDARSADGGDAPEGAQP